MNTRLAICLVAAAIGLGLGAGTPAKSGELDLQFSGVEQGKGPVMISIIAESHAAAFLDQNNTAVATLLTLSADHPPYAVKLNVLNGRYAVSAFQDVNRLGKIDLSGPFGSPAVPWGVSNNARPLMRAPDFADAVFAVGDGTTVQRIELGL
jgi:uncharacterized protein (DUF2141 family)